MILHFTPLQLLPIHLYKKTLQHYLQNHSSIATSSDSTMEAFCTLEFRRSEATGADLVAPASAFGDDEDSFFDLVLKSPDSVAVKRRDKDFQFIESPRDVFGRRSDLSDSRPFYKVTLVRSTPKFRVFMLGFGKSSKCEKLESNEEDKWSPLSQFSKSSKIEESNRLSDVSVTYRSVKTPATRRVAGENSLRSQILKETLDSENSPEKSSRCSLPRYLKLIRPLYLMVCKRQRQKRKFSESSTSPVIPPRNLSPKRISDGSRIGSFKIAAMRLGKSRSVSTAVSMEPQPARRRDDSLLERHDGIQNAVLYCKKSYNSSSKEIPKLFQSSTDPLQLSRSSYEEPKRFSI